MDGCANRITQSLIDYIDKNPELCEIIRYCDNNFSVPYRIYRHIMVNDLSQILVADNHPIRVALLDMVFSADWKRVNTIFGSSEYVVIKYLKDFRINYRIDYDSQEIKAILGCVSEKYNGATGIVTKQKDGDYTEIWVTSYSSPSSDYALYERIL